MRSLFLLLLAFNLGLFIWGYPQEQMVERHEPVAPANIGNLRLLSEREAIPAILQKPVEAVTLEEAVTAKEVSPGVEQMADEVDAEPAPAGTPSDYADEAVSSRQSSEERVEGSAMSVQIVEIAPGQDGLAAQKESAPAIERVCYRLGAFDDRALTEELAGRLESQGITAVLDEERIMETVDYWVVFPPLKSVKEARERMRALERVGIKGASRVAEGALKNSVSLGVFSQLENAEGMKQRAEEKGFLPELRPRYVERPRYWIVFESMDQPPLPDELRQSLYERFPDLTLMPRSCP